MALGTDLSQSMYVVWQWCEPSSLDSVCFRAGQCPHQFPESGEAAGFPCFQRSSAKYDEDRLSFHLIWGFRPGFVFMAITFNKQGHLLFVLTPLC